MSQNIPVQQQMSPGAVGTGGVRAPRPLCWVSPNPWGAGADVLGAADARCRQTRRMGECAVPVPWREVWRQMELCPSLLFSAGAAKCGDQLSKWVYQLCSIPGIILSSLGNHDSVQPQADLSPRQMAKIHTPGFTVDLPRIYPAMVESKTHQRPSSDEQLCQCSEKCFNPQQPKPNLSF